VEWEAMSSTILHCPYIKAVSTALCSTHCKKWRRWRLSTDGNIHTGCTWKGYNWFSHIVCLPHCTLRKSCCKISDKYLLVHYCIQYQHILLIPHTASSAANMCTWHESECLLFQITMNCFKCMSARLSPIWISMLIYLQCSERISIAKTIHEMNMC
jgi:hypothetical protein